MKCFTLDAKKPCFQAGPWMAPWRHTPGRQALTACNSKTLSICIWGSGRQTRPDLAVLTWLTSSTAALRDEQRTSHSLDEVLFSHVKESKAAYSLQRPLHSQWVLSMLSFHRAAHGVVTTGTRGEGAGEPRSAGAVSAPALRRLHQRPPSGCTDSSSYDPHTGRSRSQNDR